MHSLTKTLHIVFYEQACQKRKRSNPRRLRHNPDRNHHDSSGIAQQTHLARACHASKNTDELLIQNNNGLSQHKRHGKTQKTLETTMLQNPIKANAVRFRRKKGKWKEPKKAPSKTPQQNPSMPSAMPK